MRMQLLASSARTDPAYAMDGDTQADIKIVSDGLVHESNFIKALHLYLSMIDIVNVSDNSKIRFFKAFIPQLCRL